MMSARIMSLSYYAATATCSHEHSKSYWQLAAKVQQATLVLCCLYNEKQVGGNDNQVMAAN